MGCIMTKADEFRSVPRGTSGSPESDKNATHGMASLHPDCIGAIEINQVTKMFFGVRQTMLAIFGVRVGGRPQSCIMNWWAPRPLRCPRQAGQRAPPPLEVRLPVRNNSAGGMEVLVPSHLLDFILQHTAFRPLPK